MASTRTPASRSFRAYASPSSRSGSKPAVTTRAGATPASDGARSGETRQSRASCFPETQRDRTRGSVGRQVVHRCDPGRRRRGGGTRVAEHLPRVLRRELMVGRAPRLDDEVDHGLHPQSGSWQADDTGCAGADAGRAAREHGLADLPVWRMFTRAILSILGSTSGRRRTQEKRRTMTTVMDLSNALAGAVERAAGSVFAVHGRPRLPSTGVHWRPGLIVTANHTVEPDHEVTLTGPDGRTLSARVAGRDPSLDIAVLRAEVDGVPAADVAYDGDVRIGHLVLALGAGPRASAGIISALDVRSGRRSSGGEVLAVDLTLYPGFSGGPLIDVLGRI